MAQEARPVKLAVVAKRLGSSENFLMQIINTRNIHFIRTGRAVRLRPREIRRLRRIVRHLSKI